MNEHETSTTSDRSPIDKTAEVGAVKTDQLVERIRKHISAAEDSVAEAAIDATTAAAAKADEATKAAGERIGQAIETSRDTARRLNERADQALTSVGSQISGAAERLRGQAPEGKAGEMIYTAADALDRSGAYLRKADAETLTSDLSSMIRRFPLRSMLIALGAGLLIARGRR